MLIRKPSEKKAIGKGLRRLLSRRDMDMKLRREIETIADQLDELPTEAEKPPRDRLVVAGIVRGTVAGIVEGILRTLLG